METIEAIKLRHSVRAYTDKKLPQELVAQLQNEIHLCNRESGLNIQMVIDESTAFDSFAAHYGKFSGVKNYVALIGKKAQGVPELEERAGYYGERLALYAQILGLNTCWVALTFGKGAVKNRCIINSGEKLVCVLALGYGKTQGIPHKSRVMNDVCTAQGEMPEWFKNGMEAVLLAPTAINQQKFFFSLDGKDVYAKSTGGFYSKVDLEIVKYHFEIGAGTDNFKWKQ